MTAGSGTAVSQMPLFHACKLYISETLPCATPLTICYEIVSQGKIITWGWVLRTKEQGADLARVVACLAVFVHHLAISINSPDIPQTLILPVAWAENGKFGVSVFFVLSGFLLGLPFWRSCDSGQRFNLRYYVTMRVARLLPATWVCLILSMLFDVLYLGHYNDFTFVRLFSGMAFVSDWHWLTIFPVDANGPLWSLSFEVSSYVLMPIAFLVCQKIAPNRMKGWSGRWLWTGVIFTALLLHAIAFELLPAVTEDAIATYGVASVAARWFPTYNAFGFFTTFAIGTLAAGVHTALSASARTSDIIKAVGVLLVGSMLPFIVFALAAGQFGISKPPYGFPALPILTGASWWLPNG
jgi:peptidoglycan/LPS O-acetylase OafA/YrhL